MTRIATENLRPIWEKYFRPLDEGESIVLTRNNVPVAEVRPLSANGKTLRPRGLASGEFEVPDDFDVPLPADILKLFTQE